MGEPHGLIGEEVAGDNCWSSLRTLARAESSYGIKLWVNQQGSLKPHPCAYLDKGQVWPDGRLKQNAPPEAVLAKEISRRFREACQVRYLDPANARGFDPAKAAAAAGIAQITVKDLLDGRIWCDLPTVARIEGRLDISLWVSQRSQKRRLPLILKLLTLGVRRV